MLRGDGGEPAPATVVVDGTTIAAVEAADAPGPDDLDLRGKLVTPCFVNAHTHLAMSAFRGIGGAAAMRGNVVEDLYFRLEEQLTFEDVRAFVRMGAWESVLAGVGTVWDHYYRGLAIAEGLADVGLGGVVAPTLQDLAGPGKDLTDEAWADTDALRSEAWTARGIVPAVGPHATDTVSDVLFARIAERAEDWNLPIHLHVAQSLEEVERSWERWGCSPIDRLDALGVLDAGPATLLVHAMFASDADRDQLRPGRNWLGFCPSSQSWFAFPAAVDDWVADGLGFVVGTDCAACNDGMDVRAELKMVGGGGAYAVAFSEAARQFARSGDLPRARALQAERQASLERRAELQEPARLLQAVWADAGGLHPGLTVGELKAGARADVAIWDLQDPALWPALDVQRGLALASSTVALHGVVLGGRARGEWGSFRSSLLASDDYAESVAEAEGRLAALLARAGITA